MGHNSRRRNAMIGRERNADLKRPVEKVEVDNSKRELLSEALMDLGWV